MKIMQTNLFRCFNALTLLCLMRAGIAADLHSMDKADAIKLAASIPVSAPSSPAQNVEARMRSVGLTITGGRAYSYDSKSELDQPSDKVGDLHFTLHATQPPLDFKRTICDMWGDADFMRRAGKFYPENRSANWLMTGQCSTHFSKPR